MAIIGRYAVFEAIGSGGMATVHLGRATDDPRAPVVAVKRMHPHLAKDRDFAAMFIDEARVSGRIVHPNVVRLIDFVEEASEVIQVFEYLDGAALSELLRRTREHEEGVPVGVAVAIVADVLDGLDAAHEARGDGGAPLNIVHRDVSPQNIFVTAEGVAKVLDFGIAKANERLARTTQSGVLKGKLGYMAPEALLSKALTRQADVWAVAVLLWELLTRRRLFHGDNDGALFGKVLHERVLPPSGLQTEVPPALDAVVLRGLERDLSKRFATASAMAHALRTAMVPARRDEVGAWVMQYTSLFDARSERVHEISGSKRAKGGRRARFAVAAVMAAILASGIGWSYARRQRRGGIFGEPRPTPTEVGFTLVSPPAGVTARASSQREAEPASPPAPATAAPIEAPIAAPTSAVPTIAATGTAPRPMSRHFGRPVPSRSARPSPTTTPDPAAPAAAASPASSPAPDEKHANCYVLGDDGIWHVRPECL